MTFQKDTFDDANLLSQKCKILIIIKLKNQAKLNVFHKELYLYYWLSSII